MDRVYSCSQSNLKEKVDTAREVREADYDMVAIFHVSILRDFVWPSLCVLELVNTVERMDSTVVH